MFVFDSESLPLSLPHVLRYKSGQLTTKFHSNLDIIQRRRTGPNSGMYSELECGICFRTYNAGRRCPRELRCKHSFCQSCLLVLSRPLGPDEADRSILCPLCRHATPLSGEGMVRAELRVDECILERLMAAGVLDKEEDDPEEEEEEEAHVRDGCDDDSSEEATLADTPTEEAEPSEGSRGARLRRCWGKVWRKVSGRRSRRRDGETCITGDDMRNLAMMSCYMF